MFRDCRSQRELCKETTGAERNRDGEREGTVGLLTAEQGYKITGRRSELEPVESTSSKIIFKTFTVISPDSRVSAKSSTRPH